MVLGDLEDILDYWMPSISYENEYTLTNKQIQVTCELPRVELLSFAFFKHFTSNITIFVFYLHGFIYIFPRKESILYFIFSDVLAIFFL